MNFALAACRQGVILYGATTHVAGVSAIIAPEGSVKVQPDASTVIFFADTSLR